MCGINGIVRAAPEPDESRLRARIRRMNRAVAHRGPDGEGEFIRPGVALGHRRLAIIDLSNAAAQPMCSDDGYLSLVFNGEIYNYLELMAELRAKGHPFRSASDTEVLLRAYQEWGSHCVERFNGMWAFAIWDARRNSLFASRDRFGVKPLYYASDGAELTFSSEIAGIRAATDEPASANLGKVHDYLRYGYSISDGTTFFEHIQELRPAHSLLFENGSIKIRRYWELPLEKRSSSSSRDCAAEFSALLGDAVRLRFRSDVPVALLQSGGLDSSAITQTVEEQIERGALGPTSVTAFTAIFPGYEYDEGPVARELMRRCKHIDHVEIAPTGEASVDEVPVFVAGMGQPVFSTTSFVHWQIMREVHKRGIKVILNGQGADEAFAGYAPYNVGYRLLDVMLSNPFHVWTEASGIRRNLGMGVPSLLAQAAKAILGRRAASKWRARMVEGGAQVLDPGFRRRYDATLPDTCALLRPRNLDQHLRSQLLLYGFNQILHYEDQSSMLSSIEMRSPFVDYRLMEYAFGLPDELKFQNGITKRVIREAFAGRLPDQILNNHYKIGFLTPFNKWMQGPQMRGFLDDVIHSESFSSRKIWHADAVRKRFASPESYPRFPFWRFINLELWAQAMKVSGL